LRSVTFVSIDGPKGTGKSTLLRRLGELLPHELSVELYVERDLDPLREETESLLERHGGVVTKAEDMAIVQRLAAGRAKITRNVLANVSADIIVMDRWYPSDAYFRMCIDFGEVVAMNIARGVAVPDLVLATVCDPHESWRRATLRTRGLSSRSGLILQQHLEASRTFDRIVDEYGFARLVTDDAIDVVSTRARDLLLRATRTRRNIKR
jgi:thymidylate kinase